MSAILRNDMMSRVQSAGSESSDEDSTESIADEPGQSKPTITYDFTVKTWKDDIAFIIENKRIYAAKVVLALTSPVFEAMFGSEFAERNKNEVDLPGKQYDSFHEFLCCLYPNIQKEITIDNVYKVLPLADEYQIESLKKKCEEFLLRFMNDTDDTEKLLACLSDISLYNLSSAKDCCIAKLLDKNPGELVQVSSDDTLSLVLKKVVLKQQTSYNNLVTQLVRSNLRLHVSHGMIPAELQGFDNAIGATFCHTVTNVSKLGRQKSKQITIWNVKFNAVIKMSADDFGLFLQCEPADGRAYRSRYWSCAVQGFLGLKKYSGAEDKIKISHIFTPTQRVWGFGTFKRMECVLNPLHGYIKDDRVEVKIDLLANQLN